MVLRDYGIFGRGERLGRETVEEGQLQLNDEELQQLALFYAAAQLEGPNLNRGRCTRVMSRGLKEVSDTLNELNVDHEMEVSPFRAATSPSKPPPC